MKRQQLGLTLVIIAVSAGTILASPTGATAANVFRSARLSASASLDQSDGCVFTSVFLVLRQGREREGKGGPAAFQTTVEISVFQFNTCTGTVLVNAVDTVPVDASDYTLERLDSASLAFATQLPGDVRVSIDLAWAGSGVLRYSKFHDHERIPGCKVNFHDHLVYTFAELTGTVTVTVGGATTVLDAEDALDARLSDYKVGVTSVGCQ